MEVRQHVVGGSGARDENDGEDVMDVSSFSGWQVEIKGDDWPTCCI